MDCAESEVVCYSGHSYADHPLSFEWHGQHHVVARTERTRRVLNRQSGVVVTEFAVTTDAGQRFRLSYEVPRDRWTIEPERES